jgi:hypothetical protein
MIKLQPLNCAFFHGRILPFSLAEFRSGTLADPSDEGVDENGQRTN